jgi:hypothetical protein
MLAAGLGALGAARARPARPSSQMAVLAALKPDVFIATETAATRRSSPSPPGRGMQAVASLSFGRYAPRSRRRC